MGLLVEANERRASEICSAKERLLRSIAALPGLTQIEQTIKAKSASEAPLLAEIAGYLAGLGGKRMRPVLALMAGKLFGLSPPSQELLDVASGIELIHMATLLHDDIIDKSPLRRHKPSAFKKYGVENTLLAGDFLLTRAFSLCARLDSFIIDETERACIDLTEGEILAMPLPLADHTLNSCCTIARKKTASLFRLASVSAAHLSGAGSSATEAMREFGEHLGVAFQIVDDILDVTADEDTLGKKSGMDLRERKPSVVNVLWLSSGTPLARRLLTLPGHDEDSFIEQALIELTDSAVIKEAARLALEHSALAETALARVSEGFGARACEAREGLQALIDYTTQRIE